MRRAARAVLLTALATSAACDGGGDGGGDGGDSDGDGATIDAAPADADPADAGPSATLEQICGETGLAVRAFAKAKECRPDLALDLEELTSAEISASCTAAYADYLADGTMELGGAQALAACEAYLATMDCEDASFFTENPCVDAFVSTKPGTPRLGPPLIVGRQPVGGPCFDHKQCATGAYCDPGGMSGEHCDTCAAAKADGMSCDPLAKGVDCLSRSCLGGVCTRPRTTGEACTSDAQCRGSLVCRGGGTCGRLPTSVTAGAACTIDHDCNPARTGLYCTDDAVGTSGTRSCRAPEAQGASCNAAAGQPEKVCDRIHGRRCNGVCEPTASGLGAFAACGRLIGRCGSGLTCRLPDPLELYGNGTCVPRADGASCADHGLCRPDRQCNRFTLTCRASQRPPWGGSCDEPDELCDNGMDEQDLDGDIDCADDECSASPHCAASDGLQAFATGPTQGLERFALVESTLGELFVLGVPDRIYTTKVGGMPAFSAPTGVTVGAASRPVLGVAQSDGGLITVTSLGSVDFMRQPFPVVPVGAPGLVLTRVGEAGLNREVADLFAFGDDLVFAVGRVTGNNSAFLTRLAASAGTSFDTLVLDRRYGLAAGGAATSFAAVALLPTTGTLAAVGVVQGAAWATVINVDSGELVAQHALARPADPMMLEIRSSQYDDVAALPDGGFVAVGRTRGQTFGAGAYLHTHALVARYTVNGALVWSKELSDPLQSASARAVHVTVEAGQPAIWVGGSLAGDMALFELDGSGTLVAAHRYGGIDTTDELHGLLPRAAGGFYLSGRGFAVGPPAQNLYWLGATTPNLGLGAMCVGDLGMPAMFGPVTSDLVASVPAMQSLATAATLSLTLRTTTAATATTITDRCF